MDFDKYIKAGRADGDREAKKIEDRKAALLEAWKLLVTEVVSGLKAISTASDGHMSFSGDYKNLYKDDGFPSRNISLQEIDDRGLKIAEQYKQQIEFGTYLSFNDRLDNQNAKISLNAENGPATSELTLPVAYKLAFKWGETLTDPLCPEITITSDQLLSTSERENNVGRFIQGIAAVAAKRGKLSPPQPK